MIKSGQLKRLPDSPGVYLFKRGRVILYVGKATSLRSRVRSYFNQNIGATRGEWIVKMLAQATRVDFRPTDSVLEALVLESVLIKKHQPEYNTLEKDDSSFSYIIITREEFPRLLLARGTQLASLDYKASKIFGPFPHARELREALKLIRKIFPFRDKCLPRAQSGGKLNQTRPCFNAQIGLCPGVCAGKVTAKEYSKTIKHLKLFFAGKKKELLKSLKSEMSKLAREQKFEQANLVKKQIFALQHIQDVALIKQENIRVVDETGREGRGKKIFRIEAYDVAHLAGASAVGVMVVLEDGELSPSQYRKFKLRTAKPGDDAGALREILERRANHPEWREPSLVVLDGGLIQLNAAKKTLVRSGWSVPAVSVVKDDKHKPKGVLGERKLAEKYETEIIRANHEAHRFALSYHRQLRGKKALF